MEAIKILEGHGNKCKNCNGRIFTIKASIVKEFIVDENGNKLGEGNVSSKESLEYPYSKVKTCMTCGTLNRIGDW
jgi:hypothetical protein